MSVRQDPRGLLTDLLDRALAELDPALVGQYGQPDLRVSLNGITYDRSEVVDIIRAMATGEGTLAVDYDDDAWVVAGDRVAARVWIVSTRDGDDPIDNEVVLIANLRDGRIDRLWALAWPDGRRHPSTC